MDKKLVFISGLHRSGTSILHRIISSSTDVSGFNNTGVPEDEGQHLQTVYTVAGKHGGAGKFAFDPKAHLTEDSPLITEENRQKLLQEWGEYWDKDKSVWVEKSPPNLIRLRFLQALFPDAYFITIVRHPIVVSLATQKWSRTSLLELVDHWVTAHKIYLQDKPFIKNELFFSYEYMIDNPVEVIKSIEDFLDIRLKYTNQLLNKNQRYFKEWDSRTWDFVKTRKKRRIISTFEDAVNEFGYSLKDYTKYPGLKVKEPKLTQ